jgi:hypothetical protein
MRAAERTIEVTLLEPLFAPLESELGPAAATAFGPMVQQLLERADGGA